MGCCGQNRKFLKGSPSPVTMAPAATAADITDSQPAGKRPEPAAQQRRYASVESVPSSMKLRYLESSTITVHGPVSDRQYRFSATHPIQLVDSRDVVALLRTRFFTRA